jgi:hypothetical protein
MNKQLVISEKSEAGKFAQKIMRANPDTFLTLQTKPKDAYKIFVHNYPHVSLTYDNFWYHRGKIQKELGYLEATASPTNTNSLDIIAAGDFPPIQMPTIIEQVATQVKAEDIELEIYDPEKEEINEEIFTPYPSGKFVDYVISEDVGSMPGSTVVVTGGPSVGKTTCSLDLLYNCKMTFIASLKTKRAKEEAADDFMYLSSEMKKIDLQREQRKKVWMKGVKAILMNEAPKTHYVALLEKTFKHGYRMLVVDSFQNIVDRLTSFCGMKASEASTFLLNLCELANSGQTDTGHATCIYMIQQVTKGGVFVGKNNLKHDTTAMWEFCFDDSGERYCMFSKTRLNGDVQFKKLYYTLDENREVVWDKSRWDEDREKEAMQNRHRDMLNENRSMFEDHFNLVVAESNDE